MSKIDMLNKECGNYLNRLQDAHNQINDLERQLDLAKVNERDLNDIIQALNDELSEKERQLAGARELVFTAYQEGWNDNRNNLDCWETHWDYWETHWIDSDSKYSLEQLKEKGDE